MTSERRSEYRRVDEGLVVLFNTEGFDVWGDVICVEKHFNERRECTTVINHRELSYDTLCDQYSKSQPQQESPSA